MKQTCCICGKEDDELFMHRVQTSRMKWLCPECYKVADNEVAGTIPTRRRVKWARTKKEKPV